MTDSKRKYFEYHDIDRYRDFAELYAMNVRMHIVKIVGSGAFGVAFLTDRLTVIKVTCDVNEAVCAHRIKGMKFDHVAEVYDVIVNGDLAVVHQELVNGLNFEDSSSYDRMFSKMTQAGIGFDNLGERDYLLSALGLLPDEERIFIDIASGVNEVVSAGGVVKCVSKDDIGYVRGGFVVYKPKDSDDNYLEYISQFADIAMNSPSMVARIDA